jgi:hypothetical protein
MTGVHSNPNGRRGSHERPPKPKRTKRYGMVFQYAGTRGRLDKCRLEDLAIIDAFCKRRNVSRSSLMVQAALAFCAAKKGKPIQFRGPSRASKAWQLKRRAVQSATTGKIV